MNDEGTSRFLTVSKHAVSSLSCHSLAGSKERLVYINTRSITLHQSAALSQGDGRRGEEREDLAVGLLCNRLLRLCCPATSGR